MSAPDGSVDLGPAGRLASLFINSKLTPLLVIAALALGAGAMLLTPREEEPQIVVPVIDLFVAMPGSSVAEVENRITRPLEQRMAQIPGVENVYSTSKPGHAMITVRFFVGDDPQLSLVKVYDKIASGLDLIPPGAFAPLIKERSIDHVPVLALTLSSHRYDGFALRRLAAELGSQLARIDDVAEVRLIGGARRQLRILVDPGRLDAAGLDAADVADALEAANTASQATAMTSGDHEILIQAGGFLERLIDVQSLVLGTAGGRPIYLRDVASVNDGGEEPRDHVLFQHGAATPVELAARGARPAVTLALAKRQGADAFRVVERVRAAVRELGPQLLPPDVSLTVTRDYGATAKEKADELLLHLGLAIVSVSVLIGFFLGWRGAAVVFVSVPVSFALTLFIYFLLGYTLNRVTLFALIFVTGIVVDDSIIVVENVVRHFAAGGRSRLRAAVEAIDEVGNPTILATLTVIASVLPMAFVRGLMGPYMLPMPVGASLAMAFSLLVALVAAPPIFRSTCYPNTIAPPKATISPAGCGP